MKRNLITMTILLFAELNYANNHNIVIRGSLQEPDKQKTEVKVEGITGDSIVVEPSKDVQHITIELKDELGTILYLRAFPSYFNTSVNVPSPNQQGNYLLEIRDDNGVVYTEYD